MNRQDEGKLTLHPGRLVLHQSKLKLFFFSLFFVAERLTFVTFHLCKPKTMVIISFGSEENRTCRATSRHVTMRATP